jgi:carotenoid cleavage dioxygenase-like enzyme
MLHAVRIKAGKASYSNAYVRTSLFKQEKKAGRPLKLTVCFLGVFWQKKRTAAEPCKPCNQSPQCPATSLSMMQSL